LKGVYVDALIVTTSRLREVAAFYRALGLPLEEERHDDGPLHYACELGPVHFAIYEATAGGAGDAPGRRMAGSTLVGFQVASLEDAVAAARDAGSRVEVAPEDVPWGRRAVVIDPDGRCVELNQAAGR
jgi:lactoylglutathione lyase